MSGPRPSVSIVVATYNRRDWLRLAMDSVLAQDYPDLELLVMDDGSTDGTPKLLKQYARRHPPERFRYSRQENMGQAHALNRGYELARGELLGYLSDDDLLAPGAVSRLVTEFEDPEIVAAFPGYTIIDEAGDLVDTVRPPEYSPAEAFRLLDTVIGPGCLARREPLLSTGGWDPRLRFMGDFILWIKLGLTGPIARVPEALASWRRHGGSLSLQVAAEHGRELMALVWRAVDLLELPEDALAVRAEGLRNACVQASFFGGDAIVLGERFATIDLTRAETSAMSAGLRLTEMPDERADQTVAFWRQLVAITAELERARSQASGPSKASPSLRPGTGMQAAIARLHRAGVMPDDDPDLAEWGQGHLGIELMQAAIECGADTDPAAGRYLLLDRGAGIPEDEFDELVDLGYRATPDRLQAVIADRRRKLGRLGLMPGGVGR
jgi:Glycosyl transferase family 2